jgi:predicted metal-dependent enzyme (double-stranded beta helix superfamily)
MFDLDNFVEDCRAAVKADPTHLAVSEIMERAFGDPAAVTAGLGGAPSDSGIVPIYRSDELTIINVIWKPGMTIMPHNHEMWAVIGVYGGREDNIFWRRVKDAPDGRIEAAGAKALRTGDVAPLGGNIIHSVTNPIAKLTGAIHVYGGAFFEVERSEWDAEHLTEQAYDMAKARAMFEG